MICVDIVISVYFQVKNEGDLWSDMIYVLHYDCQCFQCELNGNCPRKVRLLISDWFVLAL